MGRVVDVPTQFDVPEGPHALARGGLRASEEPEWKPARTTKADEAECLVT